MVLIILAGVYGAILPVALTTALIENKKNYCNKGEKSFFYLLAFIWPVVAVGIIAYFLCGMTGAAYRYWSGQ